MSTYDEASGDPVSGGLSSSRGNPEGGPERRLEVRWLGRIPWDEAQALQDELVPARREGAIPDTLLLLEHPHVITRGTGTDPGHVLADAGERARRGIELVDAGRGGDVTYHGPGQLVGYPILDLTPDRKDLHRYLRDLESVLIDALDALGVPAHREEGLTGVWAEGGKVAAIGVRVSSGWITSHGFALNVSTDLSYFETIVPCGIADRSVSSVARELGRPVTLQEVRGQVVGAFARAFRAEVV